MRIGEIYQEKPFGLSIEIFPPKTESGGRALFETLGRAARWNPAFVSCTYGAGGSTRTQTLDLCSAIQDEFGLTATAHFTCVGSTRDEQLSWLQTASDRGLQNIMALRGDPPAGQESFQQSVGGFAHASELVSMIREVFPHMGIGVAGYPEKHPEAVDAQTDLDHLKHKVECGADAVYTQLFYDNDSFLQFRDRYEELDIEVPLVPGIMPITEFSRIQRITTLCGAKIPEHLASRLEAAKDDKADQFEIGVEFAIRQCEQLAEECVPGFHFYVLNRMDACDRILTALNLPGCQPQ
jgi:methylenetetrahydrofolate reductase (NADPH)